MRPFRSVALINPFIGWRHSGNYQLKQSIPSGNQSDAPVGKSPRELRPDDHLALGTKCQNFLRCGPPLHRPGDGQVGRLRELPGDVARQSEVASLWDDWGWGLRGDFEGIGNNWKEREKKKNTFNSIAYVAFNVELEENLRITILTYVKLVSSSCNSCKLQMLLIFYSCSHQPNVSSWL